MEENISVPVKPLILVAEDDDSNFKLINAIIGKKCEIKWATTGVDMIRLFHENLGKTAAMLMDIKMPEMTGLEATKAIRKEDAEIPIIMQTAYAFASDREAALEAGATEVLVKPITLMALRTCLSKFLPELKW
jgi:CheY-like chemotaxis protein